MRLRTIEVVLDRLPPELDGLRVVHLSQLIGVAAGLEESELKFKRHVVPVDPAIEKVKV